MKKYLGGVGFVVLAFSVLSCASAGPLRDRIKERMETRQQRNETANEAGGAREQIVLPPGARAEHDVAYGPDPAQTMDVYLPQEPSGPVLFMVHGGAWTIGDKTAGPVVKNKVAHWLPKGLILVSANYRLSPKADPLEQANDVAKALALAQSKASAWGGDPARFVVMGHSAGAHLISLLASDPAIAERQGARDWLGSIALDSAAFDVAEIMGRRHYRFYDKVFKSDPAYWRETSPIHRLSGEGAPMLAVCSSRRDDACPQARDFAAKAATKGRKVTVLPLPLTHREVNENLGVNGEYTEAVDSFLRSLGIDGA